MEEETTRRPVLTKRDFVKRYKAGEFGNASPTWDSLGEFYEEFKFSGPTKQLYHLRNRVKGGPTFYNMSMDRVIAYADCSKPGKWGEAGWGDYDDYYVSAMAPTERTLIQGELRHFECGLELFCTDVAKPMRDALAEKSWTVRGLSVNCYLDTFLNDNSRAWMRHLLKAYPDHVIEFSTYNTCWGTVPGHNTVFWEVRKY